MQENRAGSRRKVIFVGGTAYSGSTLLCLTLANDPEGFATGEVQHAFYPWMAAHRNYLHKCTCGAKPCPLWFNAVQVGPSKVYGELFNLDDSLGFLVDSSKNVFWTADRARELRASGIVTKNILVWKSPSQLKASYEKRGRGDAWLPDWLFYHRLYFTLIADHMTVAYNEYTADPTQSLQSVCSYTNIEYFSDKELYWNKQYHSLGGNPSARVHLYDDQTSEFARAQQSISQRRPEAKPVALKEIYQVDTAGDEELLANSPLGLKMLGYLRAGAPKDDQMRRELCFSPAHVAIARAKLAINRRFGRIRHGL